MAVKFNTEHSLANGLRQHNAMNLPSTIYLQVKRVWKVKMVWLRFSKIEDLHIEEYELNDNM